MSSLRARAAGLIEHIEFVEDGRFKRAKLSLRYKGRRVA